MRIALCLHEVAFVTMAWISDVTVRRYRGFGENNLSVAGLKSGLNVVVRPNRWGKSTLTDALKFALLGQVARNTELKGADVLADLHMGESTVSISVLSGSHASDKNLPNAAAYFLKLSALEQGLDAKDATSLETFLLNGVQLPAIDARSKRLGIFTEAEKIADELKQFEGRYREYEQWKKEFEDARQQVEQGQQQLGERPTLQAILLRQQLQKMDAEMPGLENQPLNPAELIERSERELNSAVAELERIAGECRGFEQDADPAITVQDVERIRKFIGNLKEAQGRITESRSRRASALEEFNAAKKRFDGFPVPPEAEWELLEHAVDIAHLADEARTNQTFKDAFERAELSAEAKIVQGAKPIEVVSTEFMEFLGQITRALEQREVAIPLSKASLALLGIGALLIMAGAGASLAGDGMIGASVVVLGLILAGAGFFLIPRSVRIDPAQELGGATGLNGKFTQFRADYKVVSENFAWQSIRDYFKNLGSGVSEEAQKRLAELPESQHDHFNPYAIAQFCDALKVFRLTEGKLKAAEGQLASYEAEASDLLRASTGVLAKYGWNAGESDLESAWLAYQKWQALASRRTECEHRVAAAKKDLAMIFARFGVDPDDPYRDAKIHERAAARREYDELLTQLHSLRKAYPEQTTDLAIARIERLYQGEELLEKINQTRAMEQQLNGLIENRAKLRANIDAFEQDRQRLLKMQEFDAAMAKGEVKMLDILAEDAQRVLVSHLREQAKSRFAPEVLLVANAKLKAVDAQLSLELGSESKEIRIGRLRVNDLRNNRTDQGFHELSDSAKLNVVLAVKLALVELSEEDVRYPFFADEVLAVADAETKLGLARLLANEARTRQVVVLTNDANDIHAFEASAASLGVTLHVDSLGTAIAS